MKVEKIFEKAEIFFDWFKQKRSRFFLSSFSVGRFLILLSSFLVAPSKGQGIEPNSEGTPAAESKVEKNSLGPENKETKPYLGNASSFLRAQDELRKFKGELKLLIKSEKSDVIANRVLEEFFAVSHLFVAGDVHYFVQSELEQILEILSKDEETLPHIFRKVENLDQPILIRATLFDMMGASEQAVESYAAFQETQPSPDPRVTCNQIRLVGPIQPHRIATLLQSAPNDNRTKTAITTAFTDIEIFERSVQFMNALASYVEDLPASSQRNLQWLYQIEYLFKLRVWGQYQMPPLWEPWAAHSTGYKGLPSTAEMRQDRLKVYERFCRATLRHPSLAARGFSRLASLATLQGGIDNNQNLFESALSALNSSQERTPLGFFSPELYLARVRWKEKREIPKLPSKIEARISQLEGLLAADAAQFQVAARELINEPQSEAETSPNQASEYYLAGRKPRRLHTIFQIASERKQPDESLNLVLEFVKSEEAINSGALALVRTSLMAQLNVIAKNEGSERIDEILEELAQVYLGPWDRDQVIATLPDPNARISWIGVPAVVQYVDFLQAITVKPVLVPSVLKKAEELGIQNRINPQANRGPQDHFYFQR